MSWVGLFVSAMNFLHLEMKELIDTLLGVRYVEKLLVWPKGSTQGLRM